MVNSAAIWMKMGLPLQCFKIVVYAKNPKKVGQREQGCVEVFSTLKKKIEKITAMPKVSN